jgi:hypothetical protein
VFYEHLRDMGARWRPMEHPRPAQGNNSFTETLRLPTVAFYCRLGYRCSCGDVTASQRMTSPVRITEEKTQDGRGIQPELLSAANASTEIAGINES